MPPQNQVKSTSPASVKQESSDYNWQLILQEFPLDNDVSEDKLQNQRYFKYEDLPSLHKISEEIFQAVFDKVTPEEHRLMSFLTPEEKWEFLHFCETPLEWTLSFEIEENFDKLAHEFFDFLTEEEKIIHSSKLVSKLNNNDRVLSELTPSISSGTNVSERSEVIVLDLSTFAHCLRFLKIRFWMGSWLFVSG